MGWQNESGKLVNQVGEPLVFEPCGDFSDFVDVAHDALPLLAGEPLSLALTINRSPGVFRDGAQLLSRDDLVDGAFIGRPPRLLLPERRGLEQ